VFLTPAFAESRDLLLGAFEPSEDDLVADLLRAWKGQGSLQELRSYGAFKRFAKAELIDGLVLGRILPALQQAGGGQALREVAEPSVHVDDPAQPDPEGSGLPTGASLRYRATAAGVGFGGSLLSRQWHIFGHHGFGYMAKLGWGVETGLEILGGFTVPSHAKMSAFCYRRRHVQDAAGNWVTQLDESKFGSLEAL